MKIWTDGAGWNGEVSGIAMVVERDSGVVSRAITSWKKEYTNNEMEYFALLSALEFLQKRIGRNPKATIYVDSKLVANQLSGEWKLKAENLFGFHSECKNLLKKMPNVSVVWESREKNKAGKLLEKIK